jgi:threonine synthase
MQGVVTIAHELGEQAPDAAAVYVPVGGGGLLAGLHRGFCDTRTAPRLVGVQPAGNPTLRSALDGVEHPRSGTTISGLQVELLAEREGAPRAVNESGGHVVEVADEAVHHAQQLLARADGVFVEPAGAAALAGLLADAELGRLDGASPVVVMLTGAGWKDLAALERLGGGPADDLILLDQVDAILARR